MIVELNSEDDLWRLFGGEDHSKPGKWQQPFATLERQLHDYDGFHSHKPDVPSVAEVKRAKSQIKPRFPLKDQTRRYLLMAGERQVCVNQSSLLPVGKAMLAPELVVQYLGCAIS